MDGKPAQLDDDRLESALLADDQLEGDQFESDQLDDLEEALAKLEAVDPAETPALAHEISDRLARALDSTEAP